MITQFTLASVLWIVGALMNDYNVRLACWITWCVLDILVRTGLPAFDALLGKMKKERFGLPINIEHMAERYGLFTILVLGELVVAAMSKLSQTANSYGSAICALLMSLGLQWIYFDIEAGKQEIHAMRRKWFTGVIWSEIHMPLSAALLCISAGFRNVIAIVSASASESILLKNDVHE
jgi:low temperature requirement protein LtrA